MPTPPTHSLPLTGDALEEFRLRHGLDAADMVYAFGLPHLNAYEAACRQSLLSIPQEILIRIYDRSPGMIPWTTTSTRQAFEMLYGNCMRQWADSLHESAASHALFERFAGVLGLTAPKAGPLVGRDLKPRPDIARIFAKLSLRPSPREELEAMSREVLSLRGRDLDAEFPMPTSDAPPPIKTAGGPPEGVSVDDFIADNAAQILEILAQCGCPRGELKPLSAVFKNNRSRRRTPSNG